MSNAEALARNHERERLLSFALPPGADVIGLGTDICEVPRIQRAWERHGDRFLEKVFHRGEVLRPKTSPNFPEHLAGLFAAKEAVMKALGTGMDGTAFREIAIPRAPGGPPRIVLFGRALARAEQLGASAGHVSITHTAGLAFAVAVLMRSARHSRL